VAALGLSGCWNHSAPPAVRALTSGCRWREPDLPGSDHGDAFTVGFGFSDWSCGLGIALDVAADLQSGKGWLTAFAVLADGILSRTLAFMGAEEAGFPGSVNSSPRCSRVELRPVLALDAGGRISYSTASIEGALPASASNPPAAPSSPSQGPEKPIPHLRPRVGCSPLARRFLIEDLGPSSGRWRGRCRERRRPGPAASRPLSCRRD